MTIRWNRIPGQTRLGIFTNLWPTRLCAVDRATLECWYLDVHVGARRLSLIGPLRK